MFDRITGHDGIKNLLYSLYKQQRIPPFLIFEGPLGVGKAETAYEFAKLIMFDGEGEPLRSPDFYLLTPVENPDINLDEGIRPVNYDPTKDIKIDAVRHLQKELSKKGTFKAKKRVVLILNGENLNVESQNSFLKTLEDPPYNTVIIMITSHRERVLPTVYSRAKKLIFRPLSIEDFKKYPFEGTIPVVVLYSLSGGSIGRAKHIEDSFVYSSRKEFIGHLINRDFMGIQDYFEEVSAEKSLTMDFLEMFSGILRDIIVTGSESAILNEDIKTEIENASKSITNEKVLEMIERVKKAYNMVRANVQRRYVLLLTVAPLFESNIRDKYDTLFDYLYEP